MTMSVMMMLMMVMMVAALVIVVVTRQLVFVFVGCLTSQQQSAQTILRAATLR